MYNYVVSVDSIFDKWISRYHDTCFNLSLNNIRNYNVCYFNIITFT